MKTSPQNKKDNNVSKSEKNVSGQGYFWATYKNAVSQLEQNMKLKQYLATSFPEQDVLRDKICRFATEGGKRFRPALAYVTASSFGKSDIAPHLALEAFHKFLLTHDDIIDRDDVRYNASTVHANLAKLCRKKADQEHFGNSLAIIGGDLLAAGSYKIVLNSHLTNANKLELISLLIEATEEVAWGWYDQFLMDYLPLDSEELSQGRIETSMAWVTGKYSIKLPLLFGYGVAGVPPPAGLEKLADTLGLLFQTGDDIIGLFGKPDDTGKSNDGDISQGKKTLPMWLAFSSATAEDKQVLNELVGKPDITKEQAQQVRDIVDRSGGLSQTEALMSHYKTECLQQLDEIDIPEDLRRFLRGFVEFLEKRDR
ncbi:MAG: polyprenyl synthetase family protein [Candidatus Saccharibacteria bacterium]|nr:polyprenyl synthetase family protein [Candidatus Saccharibacteria bacterium]